MSREREQQDVQPDRRRESSASAVAKASAQGLGPALRNAALQRLFDGVQRSGPGEAVVEESVARGIEAKRGRGRGLDPGARAHFEEALNEDFSDVRVHTDAEADGLSRSLAAEAFTTGSDIFFRSGTYEPLSASGRKLIAHELTHVVQQRGALAARELRVTNPGDASEREATAVAEEVARLPTGRNERGG